MKYANRCKHKLKRVYQITYLSLTGIHFEFVKCEKYDKVSKYAEKEAKSYGCVVTDISLSELPKNLNNNENFTDLF